MTREQLLRRFEQSLDAALANEPPPSGLAEQIDAEDDSGNDSAYDSYALWAALTALTQEVRLEGRAFQELNHTVGGQTEKIAAELRAVWTERERGLQREAERRCRREILGSLVDLRDRLGRGLELSKQPQAKAGFFERLLSKPVKVGDETLHSLVRGYELGLERLDQTLTEFNAQPIRCEGEMFDPRRMNAIESEETDAHPEGAVLAVFRSGYEWNGEVFRTAQVKVARSPSKGENTGL